MLRRPANRFRSRQVLLRYGDLTVFNMAAIRHLYFQKFAFWAQKMSMRRHVPFRGRCLGKAVYRLFQNGGHSPSWICFRVLGPSTKSTLRSLSLCKIWFESVFYFRYNMPVYIALLTACAVIVSQISTNFVPFLRYCSTKEQIRDMLVGYAP